MRIPAQIVRDRGVHHLAIGEGERKSVVETGADRSQHALRTIHRDQGLQFGHVHIGGRRRTEVAREIEQLVASEDVHRQPLAGVERRIPEQILVAGHAHPEPTSPVADERHLPAAHKLVDCLGDMAGEVLAPAEGQLVNAVPINDVWRNRAGVVVHQLEPLAQGQVRIAENTGIQRHRGAVGRRR